MIHLQTPSIHEDAPDTRSNHDPVVAAINTFQNPQSVGSIKERELKSIFCLRTQTKMNSTKILKTYRFERASAVFYLVLLPAFQGFPGAGSSNSKFAGLHAVSSKHISNPTICWNQTTIHKFNVQKNLYLNKSNITINYLW